MNSNVHVHVFALSHFLHLFSHKQLSLRTYIICQTWSIYVMYIYMVFTSTVVPPLLVAILNTDHPL